MCEHEHYNMYIRAGKCCCSGFRIHMFFSSSLWLPTYSIRTHGRMHYFWQEYVKQFFYSIVAGVCKLVKYFAFSFHNIFSMCVPENVCENIIMKGVFNVQQKQKKKKVIYLCAVAVSKFYYYVDTHIRYEIYIFSLRGKSNVFFYKRIYMMISVNNFFIV